jgi:hypothetical protein
MRINFFEECIDGPEVDLQNARFITWPSTIYIAATSLDEFKRRAAVLASINPEVEAAYWPILPYSYWISPFSNPDELDILRNELLDYEGPALEILLDLELPILKTELFRKNARHFFSNRKRIRRILRLNKKNISFSTAEYWYAIGWARFLTRIGGVSYPNNRSNHNRLIMYYRSTLRNNGVVEYTRALNYMNVALRKEAARKQGVQAALGCTSIGIFGDEQIMTPEEMDTDLQILEAAGFREATVFRLAGIEPYLDVLQKHTQLSEPESL